MKKVFLLITLMLISSGVLAEAMLSEKDSIDIEGVLEGFDDLSNGKTVVSTVFEKMNYIKLYNNKTNEWPSTVVDGAVITKFFQTSYNGLEVLVGLGRDFVPERNDGKVFVLTMEGVGAEGWHLRGDPTKIRGFNLKGNGVAGAIEDLDGDGEKDVIVLTELNYIYGLGLDAKAVWTIPSIPLSTALKQAREIIVSDLDGDGKKDVIVGTGNSLLNLTLKDGKQQGWKKYQLSDLKNNINSIAYSSSRKKIVLGTDMGITLVSAQGEREWFKDIGEVSKILIRDDVIYAAGREGVKSFDFEGNEKNSWGENISKVVEGLNGLIVANGSKVVLLDYELRQVAEGTFPQAKLLKKDAIGTENKIIYLQKESGVAADNGITEVTDGETGTTAPDGTPLTPGIEGGALAEAGQGFFESLSIWHAILIVVIVVAILIVVVLILKNLK